jgi:hypothetical protein
MIQSPSNLVLCRECRKDVSSRVAACPHCGALYPTKQKWNGWGFEWKSQASYYGYPLIHIAVGMDKNKKLRVAKGIIAIGQFGVGLITIAQFGIGVFFGIGQFMVGAIAVGQIAVALILGMGQIATGYVAIGQVAFGYYAWAQQGFAKYLWTKSHHDPEAGRFFSELFRKVKSIIGK